MQPIVGEIKSRSNSSFGVSNVIDSNGLTIGYSKVQYMEGRAEKFIILANFFENGGTPINQKKIQRKR